jgi:enamine deaminase RidA (YjgF/YER057c/UK114 family)
MPRTPLSRAAVIRRPSGSRILPTCCSSAARFRLTSDDVLPAGFEAQARQVWLNVDAQLKAAGMSKADIVKVTTYLSDRHHTMANREIRAEYLGSLGAGDDGGDCRHFR